MNLNSYNLKNEPFYKRYFTGNILLISVWLFFFPSLLDVLFPIWGFHDYANSGISAGPYNSDINYVQLLASLVVVVFINFFWVYATLPGNMRINGGAGPREFLYYISVIGLIYLKCIRPCFGYSDRLSEDGSEQPLMEQAKFNSEFSQHRNTTISIPNISSSEPVQNWLFRVFGSDYTIGVLIFSLSSTAGLIISGIMAFDNSTDPEYIYGVICSLIFTLGTYFLLYGSHPLRMYQHDGSGSHDFFLLLQKMCGSTAVKVDGI